VSVLEIRGVGIFGEARQSLAADAINVKDNGADLAKQEIALAKEALTTLALEEKQGQADLGSHDIFIWSRRLVEATRKSGAAKAEVMREIKDHLVRMDERVELVKALETRGAGNPDGCAECPIRSAGGESVARKGTRRVIAHELDDQLAQHSGRREQRPSSPGIPTVFRECRLSTLCRHRPAARERHADGGTD
jgi:hypothetical protein